MRSDVVGNQKFGWDLHKSEGRLSICSKVCTAIVTSQGPSYRCCQQSVLTVQMRKDKEIGEGEKEQESMC